ncbi:hypothetical protein, partial [Escherichia coli]|uniref:hypothetical protein n=1 Tax=Escherichia coli TaxID=562 RepID=UPI00112F760D
TADRNRSHWSTSKTPSYTKSVSWHHHPKNDPDTKKVWCKYGKIPGQGDGVNLFFVGEINVTHYFITNIGAGLPDACAE